MRFFPVLLTVMIAAFIVCFGCSAADAPAPIDNRAWLYNAEDDVYYQIGISYCGNPADETYENLAVFVPGSYFKASENGDGTYSCEIAPDGTTGDYTAMTAPIVFPVNTPGYSAMAPLTEYSSPAPYTQAGFIYVHAGCRGRDHGAPAGITDLKAAVRYIRYNTGSIPGNTDAVFTFGMSGGGAQSALMGSTGDSDLYTPYLEAIGAVQGYSDTILGAMCWCPITNLDTADEAYEWMMGITRSGLSDEEQAISDNLAAAFAVYINNAGFRDPEGNLLTLEASGDGIYQSGSYYRYIKSVIERSLNNFLKDTAFPYDASAAGSGGFRRGGPGGPGGPDGDFGGGMPEEGMPEGFRPEGMEGTEEGIDFEASDNIARQQTQSGLNLSGTYDTIRDYIDALNAETEWVTYSVRTGKAEITSVADFVRAFKNASKRLAAFDQLDGGQGENTLFGYGDGKGAHFDSTLSEILSILGSEYAAAYAEDLEKTDQLGNTAEVRLNMYTPLYYLLESEEGYGTAGIAPFWRIRTGIAQSDCALSTEVDLALALENYEGVRLVDFETIWGAGHTMAERSGNSTDNFIAWVGRCMSIRE